MTPKALEPVELLPCPFCGGRGEPCVQRWMKRDHWGVVCQGDCNLFFDCRADTRDEAIAAWNKRFKDHPLVQMVEMDEKLGLLVDAPEAAQPVGEPVERVARALFEHEWSALIKPKPEWGFDGSEAYWREAAQAAIEAMNQVNPEGEK